MRGRSGRGAVSCRRACDFCCGCGTWDGGVRRVRVDGTDEHDRDLVGPLEVLERSVHRAPRGCGRHVRVHAVPRGRFEPGGLGVAGRRRLDARDQRHGHDLARRRFDRHRPSATPSRRSTTSAAGPSAGRLPGATQPPEQTYGRSARLGTLGDIACGVVSDPVNTLTGAFTHAETDLRIAVDRCSVRVDAHLHVGRHRPRVGSVKAGRTRIRRRWPCRATATSSPRATRGSG